MIYKKINYINWKVEAIKKVLTNDEMLNKINEVKSTRTLAKTKTKREDFDNLHYGLDKHGDWVELYLYENGQYYIYSNNVMDSNKNIDDNIGQVDRLFDFKFRDFNNVSLRVAFGYVDKSLKICIPKQFYYIREDLIDKFINVSSIDASSQYPSGCLGRLPDAHTMIKIKGRVKPTEEYPFAFYSSGHCAEYGVFDTHSWFSNIKLVPYLFRFNQSDEYPIRMLRAEEEETILMKASQYTMDSTWNYFYNNKESKPKDSKEYKEAKLIMNKTIGCWHRKDKSNKRIMTYDNHGSYQMAHIVAIAIARGNQKILNKIAEIGLNNIVHICVDGIIYLGNDKHGQDKNELGKFSQEFTNAKFKMIGINAYCAKYDGKTKFKHGGYDLLDGKEISETQDFDFEDLYKLGNKEHVGDLLWEDQKEAKIKE